MSENSRQFDCAIVGGGLAGLCLAIQLADAGFAVVVFEKNQYPFHKVCGEYISMESWSFLNKLGLPLQEMNLPEIKQLGISSHKGFMLNQKLDMGGFGISRFTLDHRLSELAVGKGVTVLDGCRVNNVHPAANGLKAIQSAKGDFLAKVVCGSFGKYNPAFVEAGGKSGLNYIGVKYHIKTDLAADRIELHNFDKGYCGISRVDNDQYCLCYLTESSNLHANGKNIKAMEEAVLCKNPYLKKYFTQSEFVYDQPQVISNISFSKKSTYSGGMFLLGDAAGSITPLCGNGMSMGMRASYLLAGELVLLLSGKQDRDKAVGNYDRLWNLHFSTRIKTGSYLQYLFGKNRTADLSLKVLDKLPRLTSRIISLTHGDSF